ncbi:Intramembrane protease RasP/YluC, implicated in cell division based on FtsL cleavage [hydrothermal vent metagenome]|uniref:Intramembrane protease RasP/YluC, implicated in cell division based on FtsL cleavage n=1 Tax=hydrothermal vent metagenome TaxID=652676 RepID=A0A3B0YHA7_9ZZZZ
MSSLPGMALAFIIAISVLVAIHEFGHFWVAKKLGVKVLRFSIGFGKPLYRRTFGADNTEFVVAALPLGGYVKMLDEREAPVEENERGRAFNQKPLWVRSAVILAGPLFNFLFAIFAFWLMFVSGVPGMKPVLGEIEPASIAARAGFSENDEILSIDGVTTQTWDEATMVLLDAALANRHSVVKVKSQSDRLLEHVINFSQAPDALAKGGLLKNLGFSLWRPRIPAVIDIVVPDKPAERAGLLPGDKVIAVNGEPMEFWREWVDVIRANPGKAVTVRVLREGEAVELELMPEPVEEAGETVGKIGAAVQQPKNFRNDLRVTVRYSAADAIGRSVAKTWETSALTVRTLWGMLAGRASVENISGPLSIAQYAGYSASGGLASFLKFLAIVSVSLGVLNLLPVPILDGGHLLYNIIEWLQGKPLSEYAQQIGQQLGIVMLLLLMSIAFYNDLSRLFGA